MRDSKVGHGMRVFYSVKKRKASEILWWEIIDMGKMEVDYQGM